jgi:hypothetical protein
MVYAAATFWVLVVVLAALGVFRLWSGLVRPKIVNVVLLPGTLVAQIGHVLGLLVTGATVRDTTLIKDDESGEPATTQNPEPRIPVIGPIVIGMLPLIACAAAISITAGYLGDSMLSRINAGALPDRLPTSWAAVWELMRSVVTVMESFVEAVRATDLGRWQSALFLYLVVCLTVRMAPFEGSLRGSLGAILVLGVVLVVLGSASEAGRRVIQDSWGLLALSVGVLLFLLLASLLATGLVRLVKLFWPGGAV